MKRVLLVAWYFQPRNCVASYRAGCFAKYLPENGWTPTVLCEDWPASNGHFDPDFVPNFPSSVCIARIPSPRPKTFWEKVVLRKLLPYWRPYWAPYRWRQDAWRKMQELMSLEPFDAIWATSDPLVTLGLADQAALAWRIPWVADFRDSFNVMPFGKWYKRPIWAWHEARLCRRANAAVTVSRGLAAGLSAASGREVAVIENGFDPDLFSGPTPPSKPIFSLAYTGRIVFPFVNPRPLLEAIDDCIRTGAIPRDQIELVFYEAPAEVINLAFPGATTSLPVRVEAKLPHKDIVVVQRSSSALVLLNFKGTPGVLTGKLFDYLGAKRPILAVPDDRGEVSELLSRTNAGVSATSVAEISAILKRWYEEWKRTGTVSLNQSAEQVETYSRRAQTKRLAAILNRLTDP